MIWIYIISFRNKEKPFNEYICNVTITNFSCQNTSKKCGTTINIVFPFFDDNYSKIFFKSWNGICIYKLKCQCFIYITFDRFDRTFVHYFDLKMEKKLISISFTEKTEVMHLNEVSSMKTNFLLILSFFVKLIFFTKISFFEIDWIAIFKLNNTIKKW